MGCGGSKEVSYSYKGKKVSVTRKQVMTVQGVIRVFIAKKRLLQRKFISSMTGKFTTSPFNVSNIDKCFYPDMGKKTLFEQSEFHEIIKLQESKKLIWKSSWKPVKLATIDRPVQYLGYWSVKYRNKVATLGELMFEDGTIYRGQISPKGIDGKGSMIFKN